MKGQKPVKVSVVVPVYNVEQYVERCVTAITSQTLQDFEIVCVDDGSTDGSGRLLDGLSAADGRIRVIHQANAGAGAARNAGLEVARGEYVFFFDPDDTCSRHMLKGMYAKAVKTRADIVIAGKCMADAESGKIVAKYGFHRNIWALRQPFSGKEMAEHVFTLAKSVPWDKLFRREFIEKNGLRFQNTRRSNDVYFVDMALALAERIALVPRAYYVYSLDRKGSLQSAKDKTPLVFLDAYDALEKGLRERGVFDWSKTSFARVLWRTAIFNLHAFGDARNVAACYERVRGAFMRLRPEVDLSDDTMLPARAVALYDLMLNEPLPDLFMSALSRRGLDPDLDAAADAASDKPTTRKGFFRRTVPIPLREFVKKVRVRLLGNLFQRRNVERKTIVPGLLIANFITMSADRVVFDFSYCVRGVFVPDFLPGNPTLLCCGATARKNEVVAGVEFQHPCVKTGICMSVRLFRCEVRLDPGKACCLTWDFGGNPPAFTWKNVKFGPYSPLTRWRRSSSFRGCGWIVRMDGDRMLVTPDTLAERAKCVLLAALEAVLRPSLAQAKASALKTASWFLRAFRRRPLWLFADRPDRADDNARALFEYACTERSGANAPHYVFAVSRSSPDFAELSRVGRCVDIDGFLFKVLFLSADFMISAYRTPAQRRPFSKKTAGFLRDFFARRYRFAFLKHGVNPYNMAAVLGRNHLNARIVTATTRGEYAENTGEAYEYSAREVKLCGMARYDKLYDRREGFVTFMPTWRAYLMKGAGTDQLEDGISFPESSFCKCFAEVFGDAEFVSRCEALGFRVRLMPHPNMRSALADLRLAPSVSVIGPGVRYRDVFATSDMIVTDYSSVAFDVAYLKKPVLYYQFDEEEFFRHQYQKGFFDWRRDGFGEVLTDAASLKETILSYLASGCQMKPEYQKRVDDFFAFTDRNNCKRVYDAILEAAREDGIDGKA